MAGPDDAPAPARARLADVAVSAAGETAGATSGDEHRARGHGAGASRPRWRWPRRIVVVALLGGAGYGAFTRRHELARAARLLAHLGWGWLLVAIVFEAASLVAFARLQRWLLAAGGVRVGPGTMLEIVLAGNALSMSLPGGAAWAAAWAFGQLRRRNVDRVLAAWVVLMAGALASFALFLLFVVGALLAGSEGPVASLRWVGVALATIPAVVVAVAVLARRAPRVRAGLRATWRFATRHTGGARVEAAAERLAARVRAVQPTTAAWAEAFGLAMVNWLATCACLVACIWAVHGSVPWHGILVAFAAAQVFASIPITPGGIGIVEGGLTALLVAYGMPTQVALAAVLLFRAVSFWALVPIGWGVWGSLELGARGRARAHPWAVHRHGDGAAPAPARQAPDRILPPRPCEGCEQQAAPGPRPRRPAATARRR
jgi:uncharacterized protein (TIRG00374 family)